jgi:hypothetical protein
MVDDSYPETGRARRAWNLDRLRLCRGSQNGLDSGEDSGDGLELIGLYLR